MVKQNSAFYDYFAYFNFCSQLRFCKGKQGHPVTLNMYIFTDIIKIKLCDGIAKKIYIKKVLQDTSDWLLLQWSHFQYVDFIKFFTFRHVVSSVREDNCYCSLYNVATVWYRAWFCNR